MIHFLKQTAIFCLASLVWLIFIFFLLCCIPCAVLDYIRKAYEDDRATSHMHRSIDDYLRNNRDDDHEYHQINTW